MSSPESLLNCLVCGKELDEEKPLISNENVEVFKRSFHCFCGLLNLRSADCDVEEIIDDVISRLGGGFPLSSDVAFGIPCCCDCFRALSELDRLQKAIEELKTAQMAHVEELKHYFQSSCDAFSDQVSTRMQSWRQLVTCIQNHLASNSVETTNNHVEGDPDSMELDVPSSSLKDSLGEDEDDEQKWDDTFVEMPVPSSPHPSCSSSPFPFSSSSSTNSIEDKEEQIPAKKRKLTANDSTGKMCLATKRRPAENNVRESSVTLRRSSRQRRPPAALNSEDQLLPSDGEDDSAEDFVPSAGSEDENDDFSPEPEGAVPRRKAAPRRKPGNPKQNSKLPTTSAMKRKRGGERKLNSLFYQITEDTLLYKFTTFKVSPCCTQLKCLEQNCSAVFHDLTSLHLFEKMTAHVDQRHPQQGYDPCRPCPVKRCPFTDCKEEFPKAALFRSHLLDHHKCITVLCEICWKPFMDRGDSLMTHKWFHRNDQEKLEVPIPRFLLQQTKRSKNSKHKWLLEVESEKSEAVVTAPRWHVTKSELFLKLSKTLLLYKFTVIKVLQGVEFHCEEPGCTAGLVGKGTDYQAFVAVKAHIEKVHLEGDGGKLGYSRKVRKCPLCLIGSDQEGDFNGQSIREHLFTDHQYPPPFLCHCCWKPLASEKSTRRHLLTHQSAEEKTASGIQETPAPQMDKVKKFACEECGKQFQTAANYRRHKQTHLAKEEREHLSCDQCPKKFTTGQALRIHMEKFHVAPERNQLLTCTICNKQYLWREKERFAIHVRSHSNEKPYVCDLCGVSFAGGDNLRKHLKGFHGDGKRHQCQFCVMNYKYVKDLRRHQLKKHGDRVAQPDDTKSNARSTPLESSPGFIGPKIAFLCEICEKVFPLKCQLTQHIKKYHADMN